MPNDDGYATFEARTAILHPLEFTPLMFFALDQSSNESDDYRGSGWSLVGHFFSSIEAVLGDRAIDPDVG